MRTTTGFMCTLALLAALCGCGKKEPAPPAPEAVTAFMEAALNGQTQVVSAALQAGMPADQTDEYGNSGLMLASFNGHTETMQALLDAGATVDLRNRTGRTALMMASSGPFPEAVRLLLDRGADINVADADEHFTALMYAAAEGLAPVVDILLAAGADPAMKDIDGDTAAAFARRRGFTALADRLQAPDAAPQTGESP